MPGRGLALPGRKGAARQQRLYEGACGKNSPAIWPLGMGDSRYGGRDVGYCDTDVAYGAAAVGCDEAAVGYGRLAVAYETGAVRYSVRKVVDVRGGRA